MEGLLDAPETYRRTNVTVAGGGTVHHIGPPPGRVPELMANLFAWLNGTDEHPLIASSVFHYEFEFIHPFEDGNGRIGRLWQTLILTRWKRLFAHVPVESLSSCPSERILRSYQAEFRKRRKRAVHRVHAGYHSADAPDPSVAGRRPRKRSGSAIARRLAQGSENGGGTHGGDGIVPSSLISQKLRSAGDIRGPRKHDTPGISYREEPAISNYRAREEGRKAPKTKSEFRPLKIDPTSQSEENPENWHGQHRGLDRSDSRTAASGRSARYRPTPPRNHAVPA